MRSVNPWTKESRNDEDGSRGHDIFFIVQPKIISLSTSCSSLYNFEFICNVFIEHMMMILLYIDIY